MPTKRCAWGTCKSDSRYPERLKRNESRGEVFFLRFPGAKYHSAKRERWIRACHRGDGFKCTYDSYICSLHFVGENGPTYEHPDPISAVTSGENAEKLKKKRKNPAARVYASPIKRARISKIEAAEALKLSLHEIEQMNSQQSEQTSGDHEPSIANTLLETGPESESSNVKDADAQTIVALEDIKIHSTECLINPTEMQKYLFLKNVADDTVHYTGLSHECVQMIYDFVKEKAARLVKWKGKRKTAKYKQGKYVGAKTHKTSKWAKLSIYEQLVFTLVRLKRNPSLKMLCDQFGISKTVGSGLFITWVLFLAHEFKLFLPFSTLKEMEGLTRPAVYEKNPCLRAIIDCTEFYIQKPSLPSSQRRTHSSYKSRNTFKLFISVSPLLHINFISKLYSGCISDKEITMKCGFLEELHPGDHVMADKGFNIQDLLALNHVRLIAPPVMYKGKAGAHTATMTRRVATRRIHVERIIRSLKAFAILKGVIPLTMKSYIDSIITVCAALVNLQPKIIASHSEH